MNHNYKLTTIILYSIAISSTQAKEPNSRLDEVTVTATREAQSLKESSHSVGVLSEQAIEQVRPGHPSEILGRIPGVHVNVTGGEGHMTAIRQPISTSPVYLYLEDGIPTRSTGFFNHNALYEVNLPQASRIEVSKGPGSALYGSDAIGAVVNVMTKPAPLTPEATLGYELGAYGFQRFLLSNGNTVGENGFRSDINLTRTDGWRKSTEYNRQGFTGRWDRSLESGASLKTVLAYSNIDQQTAGSSRLNKTDYENNPRENYTPISYRKVEATRLSMAYEKETAESLLSITPYFRSNTMELLPNWSLSYDPTVYETGHDSVGVMAKFRRDMTPMRARFIAGVDYDYSPGAREEKSIEAEKSGSVYTTYKEKETVYDYDVVYSSISPYAHLELSPAKALRVTAGLRYDHMQYEYDNKINSDAVAVNPFPTQPARTVTYNQVADTTVKYHNLSTKLGATLQLGEYDSLYVNFNEAFRTPSEGQVFRAGRSTNTTNLKPVKINNRELGLRGRRSTWRYDMAAYSMSKKDDIVNYTHSDGSREIMNAGETLHEGVEIGFGIDLTSRLSFDLAASKSKHTYESWVVSGSGAGTDYSGNEMPSAPEQIISARFGYKPFANNSGLVELEWEKIGSYWMDDANTTKYEGHKLYNLRINIPVAKKLEVYTRVMNLTDERYATSASYTTARGEEFAPGTPRTYYVGLSYQMF